MTDDRDALQTRPEELYPDSDPRSRAQELKGKIAQLEQMRDFLLQSPVVSEETLASVTRDLEAARAREAELEAFGLAEYNCRSTALSAALHAYIGTSLIERCGMTWENFDRAAWDAWLETEASAIAAAVTCAPLDLASAEDALGVDPAAALEDAAAHGAQPEPAPVAEPEPEAPAPTNDPRELKIADADFISAYTAEACIEKAGLVTVGDITHFSERELSEAGLSMSVISQLRGLLEDCGLSFAADGEGA